MRLINWVKGLFKEKEPVKTWGDFNIRDWCGDCCYVSFNTWPMRCCPDCGGLHIKKAVARQLTSARASGLIVELIHHDVEIKGRV